MISGGSAEYSDLAPAARELRAPAAHSADRAVRRRGGGFYGDGTGPPASDRRREGFPDRPARPTVMPSHAPPRSYPPRPRFVFEDAQGREQGPPRPRNRAAGRRYSADPRPARWQQVYVMKVQPSPPGPPRSMEPDYHTSIPRRTFGLPSPTWCLRVESMLCVWADWAPTDELHQAFAGMRSGSTPCQSMSCVQCNRVVSVCVCVLPVADVVCTSPRPLIRTSS